MNISFGVFIISNAALWLWVWKDRNVLRKQPYWSEVLIFAGIGLLMICPFVYPTLNRSASEAICIVASCLNGLWCGRMLSDRYPLKPDGTVDWDLEGRIDDHRKALRSAVDGTPDGDT